MSQDLVEKTEKFVRESFRTNPHYSFNDWTVMYEHSVKVKDIALQIAEHVPCDKILVAIGALLHDIGKTYKADPEVLHKDHETFNLLVAGDFLTGLGFPEEQLRKLESLVSYQSDSDEMKVIKDADSLAFYSDKRLYMLFIEWAVTESLEASIQRKLDKFSKLRFEVSRTIGPDWFDQMKQDWTAYRSSKSKKT